MSATAMNQSYAKLPARDVERARAFFVDKLKPTSFSTDNSHLFFELAGSDFMIYPTSRTASATHEQIRFVVDYVESMVSTLRSHAVISEKY